MRSFVSAALLCVVAAGPAIAEAQEAGTVMIRARPVYVSPANGSDAIPALSVPKDAIHVSSKTIPEVDVTWFLSAYVSTELVLTVPQEHDVTLSGARIGTFSHLPPTLLLQAGLPISFVRPYVGAGVNLTLITSQDLHVPGVGKLDLDTASVGLAGQVGVDFTLSRHWALNLDAKYVQIAVDVKAGGTKVSEARVNPWLLGGGVAYRF